MSKSSKLARRARQREAHKEEMLDKRNYCNVNDPTPYLAVKRLCDLERKA